MEFGYYNANCMDIMREIPDKFIDIAIVDPPYGIKQGGDKNHTRSVIARSRDYHPFSDVQPPDKAYFKELRRVSKNQIIFGANHFMTELAGAFGDVSSPCWIVWDKDNGKNDFADCELAWSSFPSAVRKFKYRWQGMLQEDMKNKEKRIHPAQKPVALYKWILLNYAHEGDVIIDTHVGSASSLIACEDLGFKYIGCEIDEVFYRESKARLEKHTKQIRLAAFMQDAI